MEDIQAETRPHFSQPFSQIMTMLIVLGIVGSLTFISLPQLAPTFLANIWLNGFILAVFVWGTLTCFYQVFSLIRSVRWIEGFVLQRPGISETGAPRMLVSLAAMLRQKGARLQLGSTASRSILDSIATRIDEQREITRYLTSTLIFLGLLGTFYGLATTVPALVETIQSLSADENESASEIFARLQKGLEGQLDGMGIAFASSLLGLAGSLVVGLLEVFAGRAQNRFYRELEDWLSTITRVGAGDGDSQGAFMVEMMDQLSEQMDNMTEVLEQNAQGQNNVVAYIHKMTTTLDAMSAKLDKGQTEALERVAASQEKMLARMGTGGTGDGIDAESRMRLRSIDVQMLRILEELSSGRQESIAEVRGDLVNLTKAVRGLSGASTTSRRTKDR